MMTAPREMYMTTRYLIIDCLIRWWEPWDSNPQWSCLVGLKVRFLQPVRTDSHRSARRVGFDTDIPSPSRGALSMLELSTALRP